MKRALQTIQYATHKTALLFFYLKIIFTKSFELLTSAKGPALALEMPPHKYGHPLHQQQNDSF